MQVKKNLKKYFKDQLLNKGFRIQNVYYFDFLQSLLYQYLKKNKKIKFIQIGANDGKRFDPIYEFVKHNKDAVVGYVIEPIKDYYNDLCVNYKDFPKIKPLNFAIHNTLQSTKIYKVGKEFEALVPEFALGIASFDKDHHKKTKIPSEYIVEETVDCISLETMLTQYKVNMLNLLILDAEGYDYEILKGIDFNKTSPEILHFEHGLKAGTMKKGQFMELKNLLNQNNYQLFISESDVTAFKVDIMFNPDSV